MTSLSPRFLTWQTLPAYAWLDTPVWVFDNERSRKLWANPAGLALWKAEDLEELLARDFSAQSKAARVRTQAALESVRRGEVPQQFWTFYPRGEPVHVSARATGILTEDGRLALLFEARPLTRNEIPPEVARRVEAFRHTSSLISLHDDHGRALTRNPSAIEAFGPTETGSGGNDLATQLGSDDALDDALAQLLANDEFRRRVLVRTRAGLRWHDVRCRQFNDPATGEPLFLLDAQDVTEAQRVHERLGVERAVLELVSLGRPLREVIEALIHGMESVLPALRFAALELRDGHLHSLSAPSLPAEYKAAIEGIPIGPKVDSCGTAAFLGEPVIVADIATDALWEDHRELALSHGLRACWSIPIMDSDGSVIGTLAAYHTEPCLPTEDERSVMESARYIAAIAMERDRTHTAIERGREQLQMILDAMPIIIAYVDDQSRYHFVNRAFEQWFGTTRANAIGKSSRDVMGETPYEAIKPQLEQVHAGEEVRLEAERVSRDGTKHHFEVHYLPQRAEDGKVLGHFGIMHDITVRKQNEKLLEYLATHDQLTGLPNRNLLSEHLQHAMSRERYRPQGRRTVRRSRPLQGDQRHARSRRRRPAAAAGGPRGCRGSLREDDTIARRAATSSWSGRRHDRDRRRRRGWRRTSWKPSPSPMCCRGTIPCHGQHRHRV